MTIKMMMLKLLMRSISFSDLEYAISGNIMVGLLLL